MRLAALFHEKGTPTEADTWLSAIDDKHGPPSIRDGGGSRDTRIADSRNIRMGGSRSRNIHMGGSRSRMGGSRSEARCGY